MLNEESRKYFTRALPISNTAFSGMTLFKESHVQHIQECSQLNEINDLIEYVKTSNVTTLRRCYNSEFKFTIHWTPTIENSNAVRAFITKTPDEIYSSDKAPVLDAMFIFATQVYLPRDIQTYLFFH